MVADRCARVMDRIGDRVALAVTLNEPNLPAALLWGGLPDVVVALQTSRTAADMLVRPSAAASRT